MTYIYFIRHGYSCANLLEHSEKIKFLSETILSDKKYKDPHLTNWGIFSSILAGKFLNSNSLENVKFDKIYCSPLIRTWETASCMFSNKYDNAEIAPFLREKSKIEKFINVEKSSIWNIPNNYKNNLNRFYTFKDFLDSLLVFLKDEKKRKFYEKNFEHIKKFKIKSRTYNKDFTEKGELDKFIEWYLKQNRTDKNIAVVCHGTLMREFIANNYKIGKKLKNNNFCIRYDTEQKTLSVIFEGVRLPDVEKIEKIENTLSLCSKDKREYTEIINSINV
jgi:broad specificity phosphatase PhoE